MAGERKRGSDVKDLGNIKGILEMRRGVFLPKALRSISYKVTTMTTTTQQLSSRETVL